MIHMKLLLRTVAINTTAYQITLNERPLPAGNMEHAYEVSSTEHIVPVPLDAMGHAIVGRPVVRKRPVGRRKCEHPAAFRA